MSVTTEPTRFTHTLVPIDREAAGRLVAYLAKRLLLTDRESQPLLFADRLNDLDVAVFEYEQAAGTIEVHDA
jgi:hypothetical protein